MNFQNGVFEASIKINTSFDQPTQIFAQLDKSKSYCWYPNGYKMNVTWSGKIKPTYSTKVVDNRIQFHVSNKEFNG